MELPAAPKLALTQMHPWVYGNSAQQWADGHHTEAIATASSAIFDVYLPAKVEMPKDRTRTDGGQGVRERRQSFLQIAGVPAGGKDRLSAYQGAQNFGLAWAKQVRNLRIHNSTVRRTRTSFSRS